MIEKPDSGQRFNCPSAIKALVELSEVYVDKQNGVIRYCIDMAFPELGFWHSIRSREVVLLSGKVEAVLEFWAQKFATHKAFAEDQRVASAVEQLNAESALALGELHDLLGNIADITVSWNHLQRRQEFNISPTELYGIPMAPSYIAVDSAGRPIEVERLDPVGQPDIDSTVSQFSPLAKMFKRSEVQEAVEQEMARYSEKRSAVGITNAERLATLKQAQAIYDASYARFEAAVEANARAVEQVQEDYSNGDPAAIEEHCDAVLLNAYCPDIISRNWILNYDIAKKTLRIDLDLPDAEQLKLPVEWRWDPAAAAAVATCLSQQEANDLCDSVAYQLVIRTIRDLFATDTMKALDRIVCNGRMVVENPGTNARVAYTVMSVSVQRSEFGDLAVNSERACPLYESLGGLAAGLPHQQLPVDPLVA